MSISPLNQGKLSCLRLIAPPFVGFVMLSMPTLFKSWVSVMEKLKWDGLEFLNKIGSQSQDIAEDIYIQSFEERSSEERKTKEDSIKGVGSDVQYSTSEKSLSPKTDHFWMINKLKKREHFLKLGEQMKY
ncbi:unnamed protein product [Vicia faba]|uniref:Uncharacterized protein n=1 Tax=Vicia faba TaxID=3906 RepID=A0AAV1BDW6_VICFA|nr:unnamed protein product [Vicia faba]